MRQRAYKLDPMLREEGGQVLVGRILEDGQVAAVDDISAERARLLHKPAELRVKLRGPSGNVYRRGIARCDHIEAALQRGSRHGFASIGARIDVAV